MIKFQQIIDAASVFDMVPDEVTEETLNDAYRAKVKVVHPDKGGSAEEFVKVDRAKCILEEFLKVAEVKVKAPPEYKVAKCQNCNGRGRVELRRGFNSMNMVCGICHGTGEAGYQPDRVPPDRF